MPSAPPAPTPDPTSGGDRSGAARRALLATMSADTISRSGNLLTATAIPWFVLETTGSATRTGLAVFAGALPIVLALFFSGVLVDRFPYRRVSITGDLASGAALVAIPILHTLGLLSFPLLLVLIAFGALLDLPASLARNALLPELSAASGMRLERAFAINEGASTVLALLTPALGGVLIAAVGAEHVLWLDAATFVVSATLLHRFVPDGRRRVAPSAGTTDTGEPVDTRYMTQLREGLRWITRERVLFPLLLYFAAMNLLIGPLDALIVPVMANTVYGSAVAFGLMAAASGGGALLGTVIFGWRGHLLPRRAVFVLGFGSVPLAVGGLALTPPLPVTLALLCVAGCGLGMTNLLEYTIYFERIPEQMRARIMGLSGAIGWSSVPVGRAGAGVLLDSTGFTAALLALSVIFTPLALAPLVVPALQHLDAPEALDAATT